MKPYDKQLVLENGKQFFGYGFGADKSAINEIVFNTSMVGYQEIVSDPSYTDQMVVMTYPLIGNYGMTDEDYETKIPTMGGLIVREYNDQPSNFRYTKTLSEVLEEYGIPGISGIDTRMLTRIIRDEGSQKVGIFPADMPYDSALWQVKNYTIPTDMVSRVSCKKRWYSRTPNHKYDVVAIDCGIKLNIIRKLNEKGCNVTVVPYDTTAENHSYAVDVASLAGTELELTHMNLLDRTAEGVASPENRLFSVQYHPESAPGPQDSAYLFDRFIDLMEEAQNHA